jgi:hypothetical protein
MNSLLGPAVLALLVAFIFTLAELVTTKYPRTFFAIRGLWSFWGYGVIYGLIAGFVAYLYPTLAEGGQVKVEGFGLGNAWVRAAVLGISAKALMHVRLFTANVGPAAIPIGIETVALLFEPMLTRRIIVGEFYGVLGVVGPRAQTYPNLGNVKDLITGHIPSGLPDEEKVSFGRDLDAITTVPKAFELFLRFVGKESFDSVFPP